MFHVKHLKITYKTTNLHNQCKNREFIIKSQETHKIHQTQRNLAEKLQFKHKIRKVLNNLAQYRGDFGSKTSVLRHFLNLNTETLMFYNYKAIYITFGLFKLFKNVSRETF